MSRLGRDYLKVGYYTEIAFPDDDVRFIAINNGVDSANQTDSDFTPFLNIINEWYAKDTSKKVRSVFRSKGQAGKPLCSNPPYGYVKDPADKLHGIVDTEAAETVRLIFKLCINGLGPRRSQKSSPSDRLKIPLLMERRMDTPYRQSRSMRIHTSGGHRRWRGCYPDRNTSDIP